MFQLAFFLRRYGVTLLLLLDDVVLRKETISDGEAVRLTKSANLHRRLLRSTLV